LSTDTLAPKIKEFWEQIVLICSMLLVYSGTVMGNVPEAREIQ